MSVPARLTFPFDTWSAQRIEVLRGPASVMYGEGAIGGAINVISKMPLTVQRNEAEVSLDSNLTRRLAVDSGGPINKDVSYRVTAIGNMSDGWVDRDKTSNVAVSAAVRVQASETLSWTLSTDYGDRSPSRYFGTPVVNGGHLDALRFKNYNVGDSNIRYRDSWNQLKDRMARHRQHHHPQRTVLSRTASGTGATSKATRSTRKPARSTAPPISRYFTTSSRSATAWTRPFAATCWG